MRSHAVIGAALLILLTPSGLFGQSTEKRPDQQNPERLRVAAGVGDYLGGVGIQGELFLLDRVSLVAGVGNPAELKRTAAVRGYIVKRLHHAVFAGGGFSPLGAQENCVPAPGLPDSVHCSTVVPKGPSVRAGYRFDIDSGLSVEGMIGMGWIGWGVGSEHEIDQGDWDPIAGLTVGYSF